MVNLSKTMKFVRKLGTEAGRTETYNERGMEI